MSFVFHAFVSVHCCLVVTCWERADLLALVCDVYLWFCHFPMWYPGSGVVLDCIDAGSLPPFLLFLKRNIRSAPQAAKATAYKTGVLRIELKFLL